MLKKKQRKKTKKLATNFTDKINFQTGNLTPLVKNSFTTKKKERKKVSVFKL